VSSPEKALIIGRAREVCNELVSDMRLSSRMPSKTLDNNSQRQAKEPLAKVWSCDQIGAVCRKALILPKLQLGVYVLAGLRNRFNGLPSVRINKNANQTSAWSLIGSKP